MADPNMFSLSGGGINPPPNLPSPSALHGESSLPAPVITDPSAMMERWANVQNIRNQNALFQQTYAARIRSGQILAGAPDTETAIKSLLADPLTAPFAGETINTLRQAELALTQIGGEVQKQSQSGLESFYKMMPSLIADPSQFDQVAQAQMATLSPQAKAQIGPVFDSLKKSLLSGLPSDKDQARGILTQRMVGYSMAAGIPPDSISAIIGKPMTVETGGMKQFGVQLPPQFGGGFAQSNALPMTPAPRYETQPYGSKGVPTTMLESGGVATPLTVGEPAQGAAQGDANALGPAAGDPSGGPSGGPLAAPTPQTLDAFLASHGGKIDKAIQEAPNDDFAKALADRYDQVNHLGGAAGAPHLLQGPSQSEAAANEASGKVVGEITSDMANDAREIPVALKRFDTMTHALGGFESGGLANVRGGLSKFLQGLRDIGFTGITQAQIDKVGNASLADTQVFNANVKPLVIAQLKAAAQGTGRVMRTEVDAFLSMMDATTDPRALLTLLNQAKYALQVGYVRSSDWPQFRQGVQSGQITNYDTPDFYQYFNDHQNMMHLPTKTGGGLQIGPTPEAAARGFSTPDAVRAAYRSHQITRDKAKAELARFGYK